jgi:hypothetical protein
VENGELAPRANPHGMRELIALGKAAGVAWAFLASRRWLVAALLATCALLALLTMGQPKRLLVLRESDAVETKFDEVRNLGIAPGSSGSWFRRGAAADASNSGDKVANQVPGLTLGSPPSDDNEPPETARLSRRLDAVRSRQSKGAWLTGRIDAVNTTGRQVSNAPMRPPAQVKLPQTADSRSNSLHATPESVFR